MKGEERDKKKELEWIIKEASEGNEEAFERLRQKYKNTVRGYITSHSFSYKRIKGTEKESDIDPRVKDIEQETWIEVWKKIPTYDPQKGSFYCFVLIWAKIMIKRHISKENREILISILRGQISHEEDEETDEEFMDRVRVKAHHSQPDETLEKYEKFLRITFSQGGPPHQLIVFGFNKLISGWGPQSIVKELSLSLLQGLSERLTLSYKAESLLPGYIVEECFKLLENKMDKKVEDVLEDRDSKERYVTLLNIKVGDSILKNYYGRHPEHNISDWSNKVRKRVLRLVKENPFTHEK